MESLLQRIQSYDWFTFITETGQISWVNEIFIVVLLTLFISYLTARILNKLYAKLEETTTPWDDAFIDAIRRPAHVLIWVLGISFAASIAIEQTDTQFIKMINPLRDVLVIATISWFILRFIRKAEDNIITIKTARNEEFDISTMDAIGKLLRATVIITSALVIMQTLGFSISGVLAFGGISGVAVGFAAKDLLANFFGALMIYLDRPFSIGDWVRSPDRSIEGTVEHIGWRQTRIRTFDKRPLYIPNSVFSTIIVENPSRMTNRRIYETIGIRYDDFTKVQPIIDDVKTMLQQHKEIDTTKTMIVNFNAYASSSLDFFVYTFTRTTDWIEFHEVKQDVLLKIGDIILKHKAEIAFPTSTIHLAETEAELPPTVKSPKKTTSKTTKRKSS